ncbi:MAG TPA: hypothetical protein VK162_26620 [Streptosporangiaceae bacterium]|nr:hypothetical protein [Streptosporangiaceae bacterium]
MKVLTATVTTQGYRGNDFDYCVEGELVHVGMVCAKDRSDPDGGCGCGRAFAGLNSHRATTTAMIREVDFTRGDYVEALRSSLAQQGWDAAAAQDEADSLLLLADALPVGVVAERRLSKIAVREQIQS